MNRPNSNTARSFQDEGSVSGCYGCGADNPHGLRIKSFWDGDYAVARFIPKPFHCAGQADIVYGGLLASLVDCHSVNHAIAQAYRDEKRAIGTAPKLFYVTARLDVRFLAPASIEEELLLRSKIVLKEGRKTQLETTITSAQRLCVEAEVLAIRVDPSLLSRKTGALR